MSSSTMDFEKSNKYLFPWEVGEEEESNRKAKFWLGLEK